jgi:hypothetical protein
MGPLNGFIAANGSNFTFQDLGASSNNFGDPSGSILRETGTAILSGSGGDSTITIRAFQQGFTLPNGPGTLESTSTANFTNVSAGTSMSNSLLDATPTAPIVHSSAGIALNAHSGGNSVGATGNSLGYTLDDTTVIALTGGKTASDQFSVATRFTDSSSVPEPASLVLMSIGMLLPLVLVVQIRRRQAKG